MPYESADRGESTIAVIASGHGERGRALLRKPGAPDFPLPGRVAEQVSNVECEAHCTTTSPVIPNARCGSQ